MTAYRDGFEPCPRCGTSLEDAGSARGCRQCRGLWVLHAVVTEMIQNMLPPGELGRLVLAVVDRAERLACPTCREPMAPTTIHHVVLDACSKSHGVWFDATELEVTLRAVVAAGSPLQPLDAPPAAVTPIPAPASLTASSLARPDLPVLYLRETSPREGLAQRFNQGVIKIGRLASAHVQVSDENVARMHAIIEMTPERIRIIDLGSVMGTLVDGKKVNAAELHDGARIQIGEVVFEARVER